MREAFQEGDTLFTVLKRQVERRGDSLFVKDADESLSYRGFIERARRIAGGLYSLGVRCGDTIFVQMPNNVDHAAICLACARIGATALLLLPGYRAGDIVPLAKRIQPVVWISPGRYMGFDYAPLMKEVSSKCPSLTNCICWHENVSLKKAEPLADDDKKAPHPSSDDVAIVVCTGGTTGFPKPVPRSHRQLIVLAGGACRRCRVDENLVYLGALPLGHIFIFAVPGFVGTFLCGGRMVFASAPSTDEVFPLIEAEKATMTAVVPPLIPIWLDAATWDESDVSSLESVLVGGAPVRGTMLADLAKQFDCYVQQAYGYTEGLVTLTEPQRFSEVGDPSVQGLPILPEDDIKIIRSDGSHITEEGEKGELISLGPYLCGHYFQFPELGDVFDAKGYIHSGDQAFWTGDGTFSICGRLKDLINKNGEKFSPLEIEEIVKRHPAVKDAYAVGIPQSDGADQVCVWVMWNEDAAEQPDLAALRAFLMQEGLAQYKLPELLYETDAWPMSAYGKVVRITLVNMAQERMAQERR